MAKATYTKTVIRVSLLTLFLAGCEGQSMDQVFGIGDANPPTDQIQATPKPKPTPTPTPPPPSPTPKPATGILKRNVAFDALRSKAIGMVLTHEIDPAIATLNSAYRIKPNDRSIQLWLDAINRSRELQRKAASKTSLTAFQNPPTAGGGVAGAPGTVGAPPVLTPPGAPRVPAPGPIPSATQIDPRLVF